VDAIATGTVTFLFTDIEGSTKLWEAHPRHMREALARHNSLLSEAIARNRGYVFKTVGDAFCATFAYPTDAIRAALDGQRSLLTENWPSNLVLKARIALHTGVANFQDGDYLGPPLNRVARLLAAGHGGQTLISQATFDLICDALPEGIELLDMGEHRLKDLTRPEHIFQVLAPGDPWRMPPKTFPPLKTLDNRPNNLPIERTPLIGREKELAKIEAMLLRSEVGLLTLTGPGGTGKTRLSLQVAAEVADHFKDGVFFINLSPIADHDLMISTVAQTLGLKEAGGVPLLDTLKSYLHDRQMLLVLDNFEQVVEAAPQISTLLSGSPQLKLMATSRVPLRVRGEHEYAVPTLTLPPASTQSRTNLPVEELVQYGAIRLFIERARAVKLDFELTDDNASSIVEICRRLDGLPLAIELAAARIRLLAPQAMLARLESRLKLLVGGARDLPARQQTLSAAIDWSYDLLNDGEKQLFRRLAVFQGGRTLEAIELVCSADNSLQIDVLDGIESLVSKSLLRQREADGEEQRFLMLETIHEYARQRLNESGETENLQNEHLSYYLRLAEQAEPELRGPEQGAWLDRLEAEHDNFRVALRWAHETDQHETGLRLAGALWRLWFAHAHLTEGRQHLGTLLAQTAGISPPVRAKALLGAGRLAIIQGDYARARGHYEEALQLFDNLGDKRGRANALIDLGNVAAMEEDHALRRSLQEEGLALFREVGDKQGIAAALYQLANLASDEGDLDGGRALLAESLSMLRQLKDDRGVAMSLFSLGNIELDQNNQAQAQARYEEALPVFRKLGDKWGVANSLANLGEVACNQEDYATAASLFEESLASFREIGAKRGVADSLLGLATAVRKQEDYQKANALLRQSLAIWTELGNKRRIIECLEALAEIAVCQGEPLVGAQLLGAATSQREAARLPLDSAAQNERAIYIAKMRGEVGETAWTGAWKQGRRMTLDEAAAFAMEII
jgi:predicted ATPase/class 3 adenylate cyclase